MIKAKLIEIFCHHISPKTDFQNASILMIVFLASIAYFFHILSGLSYLGLGIFTHRSHTVTGLLVFKGGKLSGKVRKVIRKIADCRESVITAA